MTTKKLSKEAEDRLLDAVKDVCAHVDDGLSPTDAAIKVANEQKFGGNMIKLMCQGYNVGAVNHRREQGGSILEKLSQIPLADADEAITAVYPSKVTTPSQEKAASVVDSCYSRPPRAPAPTIPLRTKTASDIRFSKPEKKPDVLTQLRTMKKESRAVTEAVARARHEAFSALGKLANYFRGNTPLPLEQVEAVAKYRFGDIAEKLSEYITVRNRQPSVKHASVSLPSTPVIWGQEPYSLVEDALAALQGYKEACITARQTVIANNLKAAHLAEEVSGTAKTAKSVLPSVLRKTAQEKDADVMSNVLAWTASRAGYDSLLGKEDPKSEENKVSDELMELSDPAHEDEIRKVRTQRMMHELMQNDNVISGYPHNQVIDAYNDLADFSPRIADKPVMVRSVLRKWLPQSAPDTFEVTDLANAEKTLAETGRKAQEPLKVANVLKPRTRSSVLSSR